MKATKHILLVEDNPADACYVYEVLKELGEPKTLGVVKDGVEGLQYLKQEEPFGSAQRPDLVLLDLNMPRKSGLDMLVEMHEDSALRTIPVVVLTVSQEDRDVEQSFALGAVSHIVKPIDADRLALALRSREEAQETMA